MQAALKFLERDVFYNIVAWKMLTTCPGAKLVYEQNEHFEAVMVLLEPETFAYDREHYQEADCIAVISSNHASVTKLLLRHLPKDKKIVFKLNNTTDALEVQKRFDVREITAFLSYTDIKPSHADPSVRISSTPSEQMYDLIASQGHTRDWLEPMLTSNRAFCCELYSSQLESVCFAFENHPQIWEIGGVFTPENSRGHGFATRTVQTAVFELQQRSRRARYQVAQTNAASICVAKNSGLELGLTITHWF